MSNQTSEVHYCSKCSLPDATIKWVGRGSMTDLVHGFWKWYCELCAAKESLEYAEEQATRIPELQAKVKELESENRSR
jgi:uncharacterized membrane protein YfbV (UPF0208 family)